MKLQTHPLLGGATLARSGAPAQAHLAGGARPAHMTVMISREQWVSFLDHPVVEWTIFGVGLLLILLSPLAGIIPGPGGIFVFALGLAMVLKTSMWAKRHYVRLKNKQPKMGRWADWGLRRASARRREAIRKEREQTGCPPAVVEVDEGPMASIVPGPPASQPEMPGDREPRD